MKFLLVMVLAISLGFTFGNSFADKGPNVDTVRFIQYLDENTALEEVRNGNLDIYYYRITSDRIENVESREGLRVFESTGGSYSILVNPAESEKFNPFSIQEIRFAINYLIDRKLIVNELMGGFGSPMISNYGPNDPQYLLILNQIESFHFKYNPSLAEEIIYDSMTKAGATKEENQWKFNEEPVEITIFIRSDDPVRKSIGEILSSELEKIGFKVNKDFGDLNKAFVVVYGSNPADLKWSLYTEGWANSAFVRYDSTGLGQMYSPWFSNMPGFNIPEYWNYKNEYIDSLTQKIYTSEFESEEQRAELIQKATEEGIKESVRIFLASKVDQYVANENVKGVINDFGAGVPSRFTPINAKSNSDTLEIGVKQIYQGAWNPIMGLTDSYSRHIWNVVSDPAIFKHPFTGKSFPVRTDWKVETLGPNEKIPVPKNVIFWNPELQKWVSVEPGTEALSKITFDLKFSDWHNGHPMDMNDILYSLYFTSEWGSEPLENDKTFDTEYTPRVSQVVDTIIGIKPIDEDTLEVYVDYWHFDEGEIADWASMWSVMPLELISAMEQAVIDGKVSFSRSGAVNKNVNWMSLLVPNDARMIKQYLEEFKSKQFLPEPLQRFEMDSKYFESRYNASIRWIEESNHAIISNGPFYVESYSPESRMIIVKAFADSSYPFEKGHWKEFEEIKLPKIVDVELPDIITIGEMTTIPIFTRDSTDIHYFVINSEGEIISSGNKKIDGDSVTLSLTKEDTAKLGKGANDLKIFAVSESVLKPYVYSSSFIALENANQSLPEIAPDTQSIASENENHMIFAVIIVIIIVVVIAYVGKIRKRAKTS